MTGMSGCLTVLLVTVACRRGVLAPEAGGVLPAELSEDLFSTEQRRLRRPKLDGEVSPGLLCGRVSSFFCGSDSVGGSIVFAGDESDSLKRGKFHKQTRCCRISLKRLNNLKIS